MKTQGYFIALAAALTLTACGSDDYDWDDLNIGGTVSGSTGSTSGSNSIDVPDIEFDTSALSESETVPSDDNDYVENSNFTSTIYITYSGTSATVSGSVSGVTISKSGAHVTVNQTVSKVAYELTGTSTDGSFKIYSENKFKLTLNGLDLTNPSGAAINCQSGKSMYVVLADGTSNTLTDGSSYDIPDDEDMKGTLFSEGQILFSGSGTLDVYAYYKNGIVSDDYLLFRPGNVINITSSGTNGVKANDGVTIRGGVLNIGVSADSGKGITCEADVEISGGRATIITSGGTTIEDNDTKSAAGVKCDADFYMTDGELNIKSTGKGGKGISADTLVTISGGTINIVTTGTQFVQGSYDSSAKGIKSDGNLNISGGDITVTCSGGDGSEGIESKATMTISGGSVVANTYDDALNASSKITISGGQVFARSIGNDAIDSNGTMYFTGGTIIGCGTTSIEGPFDCDNSTFSITGGNVLGMGGTTSNPTTSATTQPVIILGSTSYSNGEVIALTNSSGSLIYAFEVPMTYSSSILFLSSPSISTGNTYNIKTNVTLSGGSYWQGFTEDASVSGGSTLQSVSVSSTITNYSSGTMGNMNNIGGRKW